ncbi:MAG: hypothetical protein KGI50_08060 [Patescibacteria group bacterium]|nr:hypothetical protein [Patescibacteria group bacterium]MDE1971500.1 hypothetical protein [Patescibacteria group bacterium]
MKQDEYFRYVAAWNDLLSEFGIRAMFAGLRDIEGPERDFDEFTLSKQEN